MTLCGRIGRATAVTIAATAALFTLAAPTVSATPGGTESPIYHSSEDWGWLKTPGKLVPGGQYTNETRGKACSTGWIVSADARVFALTAGHCGTPGDIVSVTDRTGRTVRVGEFVESRFTTLGGLDDALIEVWDTRYTDSSIPLTREIAGWGDGTWLDRTHPTICRLGFRTGMSCGDYLGRSDVIVEHRNIADHGDSGGPVFAVADDGSLTAIAVTSFGDEYDATRASSALIAPAMTQWGLSIHS
ncbi:hypothetical protein ACWF62_14320 [Rhodococcus sp. NPDC054953]